MESTTTFYDVPEDKEYLAFESAMAMFDIEMKECEMLLEMADRKREINEKKSEIKVYEEAGTYEDLEMLYTEAENENAQDKSGIIATIGQKIQSAINAIINFFKNIFGKKVEDPDTVVVDPYGPTENNNSEKFRTAIPIIGGIVAAVAGGTMAVAVAKGKFSDATKEDQKPEGEQATRVKKIDLFNRLKSFPDLLSKASKVVTDCINGEKNAKDPEAKGFFKSVIDYVQKGVSRIGDLGKKISNVIGITTASNNNPGTENSDKTATDQSKTSDGAAAKTSTGEEPKENPTPVSNDKEQSTGESVEDDAEGDEFVETALDRILEEISELR